MGTGAEVSVPQEGRENRSLSSRWPQHCNARSWFGWTGDTPARRCGVCRMALVVPLRLCGGP
eukprot:8923629-Heterocapsa_arctica.AAC.1